MPVGAAVLVPALIGAAATGAGALISSNASNQASQVQAQAAKDAQATQLQMYNQSRNDLNPYNVTGQGAMKSLADLYGLPTPDNPNGGQPMNASALAQFTNSPDYQFTQQQGLNGLDQSAAARGTLLSGGHSKDVMNYSSGLASQQFNNYVGRLQSLAGVGENAAAGNATRAVQTGSGIAADQLAAGTAQASGIVGASNNLVTGLTGIGTAASTVAARSAYPSSTTSPLYNGTPLSSVY